MIRRSAEPSEILQRIKVRVERSARSVSFADMRRHVESRCRPENAFTWTPSYAESLLKKLAPVPRGRIDRLEKIVALCIAARASVPTPHGNLLAKAQSLLQEFDEAWDAVNAGRSRGGKARQGKFDPARACAYRLAADARRKNPSLKTSEVVKDITEPFLEYVQQQQIKVSTDPDSLRRLLGKWIDKSPSDPQ